MEHGTDLGRRNRRVATAVAIGAAASVLAVATDLLAAGLRRGRRGSGA